MRRGQSVGIGIAVLAMTMASTGPGLAADPLSNDDLADASVVAALPFSDTVDLADATLEGFEPLPAGGSITHSVWYRYTPTDNHYLRLDFDTTVWLAIYADGDYSSSYRGLAFEFEVPRPPFDALLEANRTYDIQVMSGDPAPEVPVTFSDGGRAEAIFFEDRVVIDSLPFAGPFVFDARLEPDEPLPSCDPEVGSSIWYEFTPPRDMVLLASGVFDHDGGKPVIAVYTGSFFDDLTEVSCGISEGVTWYRAAATKFEAEAGVTYLFQAANANRLYLDELIPEVVRMAGPDRLATAVAVSRASFENWAYEVFLVTAFDYPDALSAAAAARGQGPVLLTQPDVVPETVLAEILRLDPTRVVVVGGTAVIAPAVVSQLESFGLTVERWSGPDRYATSVSVSQNSFVAPVAEVWVASGENFPDAVTAGPGAAVGDRPGHLGFAGFEDGRPGPVLLVRSNSIPSVVADEITSLQPNRLVIVGGEAVVTTKVANELASLVPSAELIRVAGPDRFATSAAVADLWPTSTVTVGIATGLEFPDALTGISAVAGYGQIGPIMLVSRDTIPGATGAALERLQPGRIVILGGEGAVSATVAAQLEAYLIGR